MSILVRRSNLVIPANQLHMIRWGWKHNADAVTIDLQDGVPRSEIPVAREMLRQAVALVGKAGAEVLVRVNADSVYADSAAVVSSDLAGIILPAVESAEQVVEADAILSALERERGVAPGSIELAPSIETALGVWNIREIITASPRVKQTGADEANLAASLGITQTAEFDPFVYVRGRVCIEATAAGVQPVAVADPMGLGVEHLTHEAMVKIAADTRNLGFKGMICGHPRWVEAINAAFTPTEALVEYYTQVREVFAQALAAGAAAVPFAGRMIDVPVDEWAKDVLALSAACAARDAEKQSARRAADIWANLLVPVD